MPPRKNKAVSGGAESSVQSVSSGKLQQGSGGDIISELEKLKLETERKIQELDEKMVYVDSRSTNVFNIVILGFYVLIFMALAIVVDILK